MGKKPKKPRREKLKTIPPASLEARAAGAVITESRRGTLIRVMDDAIGLWFLDGDPFVIHLLICSAWMCLCDLGMNTDNAPILARKFERFKITAVYDFMRHAKPGKLDDAVDLPPVVNRWLLFDGINSFIRLFNVASPCMRTFMAHCALRPTGLYTKLREDPATFLPKGITEDQARCLNRQTFFIKLTDMFTAEMVQFHSVKAPE